MQCRIRERVKVVLLKMEVRAKIRIPRKNDLNYLTKFIC